MKRTLVIIPALNEEASLPGVISELRENAPELDVLVVDDGSVDATSEIAAASGAYVATLPFNLGVGGALRAGFQYAIRHGYEAAVQLDGDGQHDARQIRRLLAALDDGAAMAVGTRFRDGDGHYAVGLTRRAAMRLLCGSVSLLLGQPVTDTTSGFRAFNRTTIELFARAYPREYLSDTVEAMLLLGYSGGRIVEVPVRMRVRAAGVPSSRNVRLMYHYIRMLLVIALTASLDARRARRRVSA